MSCGVCMAGLASGQSVTKLGRCGHDFHAACISKWLGSYATVCPSCTDNNMALVDFGDDLAVTDTRIRALRLGEAKKWATDFSLPAPPAADTGLVKKASSWLRSVIPSTSAARAKMRVDILAHETPMTTEELVRAGVSAASVSADIGRSEWLAAGYTIEDYIALSPSWNTLLGMDPTADEVIANGPSLTGLVGFNVHQLFDYVAQTLGPEIDRIDFLSQMRLDREHMAACDATAGWLVFYGMTKKHIPRFKQLKMRDWKDLGLTPELCATMGITMKDSGLLMLNDSDVEVFRISA